MAEVVSDTMPVLRATDAPKANPAPEFADIGKAAFEMNPDYLAQSKKLQQENIRVAYAKNQRLPQLDLKGSYGLNGLGSDPASSWDDITHGGYPSWSAGVELHIPLGGGIRGRNELGAAKLRKEQALLMLKEIENQMLNAITTTLRKLRTAAKSVRDYEQIVAFNQDLMDTELKRLEAGKTNSQRVLEVDAALLEARNAVVEAKVQSERARLELELVQGSVLQDRSMEPTRKELEERTLQRLRDAGVRPAAYRELPKGPAVAPEPPKFSSPGSPANGSIPNRNPVSLRDPRLN